MIRSSPFDRYLSAEAHHVFIHSYISREKHLFVSCFEWCYVRMYVYIDGTSSPIFMATEVVAAENRIRIVISKTIQVFN